MYDEGRRTRSTDLVRKTTRSRTARTGNQEDFQAQGDPLLDSDCLGLGERPVAHSVSQKWLDIFTKSPKLFFLSAAP